MTNKEIKEQIVQMLTHIDNTEHLNFILASMSVCLNLSAKEKEQD